MSGRGATDPAELEGILKRLDEGRLAVVAAVEACNAEQFKAAGDDGETVSRVMERTVDDVNFYFGRLVARALKLPQPPCMTAAEFGSPREAAMAFQVAHRRFTNLLHDLHPTDLDSLAADEELGSYSLRQVLELASAQYNQRAEQVRRLSGQIPAA